MKRREKPSAFAPRACVAAAGLALSFPVWFYGWAAAGDVVFHASWYAHVSAQLAAGELYPRWLAGMNAGLGSPAFYHYPALPYHFASLSALFVPDGEYNLRALGAAANSNGNAAGARDGTGPQGTGIGGTSEANRNTSVSGNSNVEPTGVNKNVGATPPAANHNR